MKSPAGILGETANMLWNGVTGETAAGFGSGHALERRSKLPATLWDGAGLCSTLRYVRPHAQVKLPVMMRLGEIWHAKGNENSVDQNLGSHGYRSTFLNTDVSVH